MTTQDDEEEEERTPGRPNAYWARVREQGPSGFSSEFRGVNQGPHGGQQRVRPEDIIGDYDTCWCGEPADHDWPGKSSGQKHPKEQRVSATPVETPAAEVPHITRGDLNGFSDSYKEIILKAVNDYRVRFRMSNRGIMLYPHDGSTPLSLPMRENHRTLKSAKLWFVRHVADPETEKRMAQLRKTTSVEEAAKILADSVNDPAEHPPAKAKAPAPAPAPKTPAQPKEKEVRTSPKASPEADKARAVALNAVYQRLLAEDQILPIFEGYTVWKPVTALHENPLYQTNGTIIACRVIMPDGTPCGFVTESGKGASGHVVRHDREGRGAKMWGAEAQVKKKETRQFNRVTTQVAEAVKILNKVLGVEAPKEPSKAEQKALAAVTKERDKALADADKLAAARDDWKGKYEDLKAKLDLLKDL